MGILTKNKTFYIWFASYLAVFIIPLVLSLFNYLYSVEITRNESQFLKTTTQNQMKDLIDLRLTELEKTADQIIWDRQIRLYLKLNEPDQSFRELIEKKIKKIRFLNRYIDQIYIVNEKKAYSSGERIIPLNYQSAGIDWKRISRNRNRTFFYDDVDKETGKELYLITRFFMIGESKSDLYLVMFINPALLNDSLAQIEWLENGSGFVLGSAGTVLASVENITIDDSFRNEASDFLKEHAGSGYAEVEKNRHIISVIQSEVVDWYYTIILPETVLYGKLIKFKAVFFVSLSICLAAGIFLSLLFTRKNYLPVLELVNLFSDRNFKKIYQNYINEFEILETEIKSVINENISIKENFLKNRVGLKRLFLRRLIMGEEIEEAVAADLGNSFGVDFIYDNFAVIIVDSIENDSMSFFTLKKELDKKSEILEKNFNSYLLAYSGKNVIILNIEDSDDYTALNDELEAIASFLRENSGAEFIITAGKIYYSISGISLSYSEALQVLDYRTLLSEKKVLLFSELKKLKKNREFQYLSYLEDEYKIYNLLTAGKYDEAKMLLIGSMNSVEEHYIDVDILRIRLAGFKNILIEALNTILRNDPVNLKVLVKTVIKSRNFPQLITISESVFDKLSELSPDKSRSRIVESAKKFIESSYSDKDISVADIAEKLGITSQHLSKIFKEINGTGVLQYINSCRIEEAKKILLNEHDISIKDTAGIIGYYNEITFIRNFKNITGLSPGKYRVVKSDEAVDGDL